MKRNKINFGNQQIFVGIDVHKRQWNVSIRSNGLLLKNFSMNPVPKELHKYLICNYPEAEYHSVYEAGYCGFWIHEELEKLGIISQVVNPSDVPTKGKEKLTKTDRVDSAKLARALENKTLGGIYIPSKDRQYLRSLCRLRRSMMMNQTRIKNRIKGHLSYYGKSVPVAGKAWTRKYIYGLKNMEFDSIAGRDYLNYCIAELEETAGRISEITKKLRQQMPKEFIEKIMLSIPGVGFITAATLYCEIIDMKRFKRIEELASYVGLIPSTYSSGETQRSYGIIGRGNRYLRSILIESAWTAVRKDPVLLMKFNELTKRMPKSRAIVSIAKKLLRRIRHVWLEQEEYQYGIVA